MNNLFENLENQVKILNPLKHKNIITVQLQFYSQHKHIFERNILWYW